MNKTLLIGRLTHTAELSKTTTDKSYTRITLAVNRRFKNENGEREADFISVVFWGKSAETLTSYSKKEHLSLLKGKFVHEIMWTSRIRNIT